MLKIGVIGDHSSEGKFHSLQGNIPDVIFTGFVPILQADSRETDVLVLESDALIISTSDPVRFTLAEKCIRNFMHVYLDGPVTGPVRELEYLMKLADEADVTVQFSGVEQFDPALRTAKDLAPDPKLIEIQRLTDFDPAHSANSVVVDLMLQDIFLVLSSIRSNVKRVNASGVAVLSDYTDIANARIEFDNGAVANLTASRVSMKQVAQMKFYRRDNCLNLDLDLRTIQCMDVRNAISETSKDSVKQNNNKHLNNSIISNYDIPHSDPLESSLSYFCSSISNDLPTEHGLSQALRALEVAHKVIDQLLVNTNFAAGHTISA